MTQDAKEKRIDVLSRLLSDHYKDDALDTAMCACCGLDGVCVSCKVWWKMFLENTTADDMQKAMEVLRMFK